MKKLLSLDIIRPSSNSPETISTGDRVTYDGKKFSLLEENELRKEQSIHITSIYYDEVSGFLKLQYSDGSDYLLNGFVTEDTVNNFSKGNTGIEGDAGKKGRRGFAGKNGRIGPIGSQGKAGDRGKSGIPGDRGIRGEEGEKGVTGLKGSIGGKGFKGLTGDTGSAGGKGLIGDVGFAGLRGKKGSDGERGSFGEQGPGGCKGVVGKTGGGGDRGSSGQRGETGEVPILNGEGGVDGNDGVDSAVSTLVNGKNVTVKLVNNGVDYKISAACGISCEEDTDPYPCDLLLGQEYDLKTEYNSTTVPVGTTTTTTTTTRVPPTVVPPGVPAPGVCTSILYPAVGYATFTKSLDSTFANTEFVGSDLGAGWEYTWKMYTDETIWHPPYGTVTHQSYYLVMAMPRDLEDFMLRVVRLAKKPEQPDCISEGRQYIPSLLSSTHATYSTTTTTTITVPPTLPLSTGRPPLPNEFFCPVDICVLLDTSYTAKDTSMTLWSNIVRALVGTDLMAGLKVRLGVVCFGYLCYNNNKHSTVHYNLTDVTDKAGMDAMQQVVDYGFSTLSSATDTLAAVRDMQLLGWGTDLETERYHLILVSDISSRESYDLESQGEITDAICAEIISGMAVDRQSLYCDVVLGTTEYHKLITHLGGGKLYETAPSVDEIKQIVTVRNRCPKDKDLPPEPPEGSTGCPLDVCLILGTSFASLAKSRTLLEVAIEALSKYPYVMGPNPVRLSTVFFNNKCYEGKYNTIDHDFIDTRIQRDIDAIYSFALLYGIGKACVTIKPEDIYSALLDTNSLDWNPLSSKHLMIVLDSKSTDYLDSDEASNGEDCTKFIVGKVQANKNYKVTIIANQSEQWIKDCVSAGQGRVISSFFVPTVDEFRSKVEYCGSSYMTKADSYYTDSYYSSGQAFTDYSEDSAEKSSNKLKLWDFIDSNGGTLQAVIKSYSNNRPSCLILKSIILAGLNQGFDSVEVNLPTDSRVVIELKILYGNIHNHRLHYQVGNGDLIDIVLTKKFTTITIQ